MVGPEDRSVAQIVYKVRIYWALLCARYPEKKGKEILGAPIKIQKNAKNERAFRFWRLVCRAFSDEHYLWPAAVAAGSGRRWR